MDALEKNQFDLSERKKVATKIFLKNLKDFEKGCCS